MGGPEQSPEAPVDVLTVDVVPGAQPEHLHGPTLVRGDAAPLFLFGGTAEGPVVGCRERWA